jgi:hypothetical protein
VRLNPCGERAAKACGSAGVGASVAKRSAAIRDVADPCVVGAAVVGDLLIAATISVDEVGVGAPSRTLLASAMPHLKAALAAAVRV